MKNNFILFLIALPLFCVGQTKWQIDTKQSSISYQAQHFLHSWAGENNQIKGLAVQQNAAFTQMALLIPVKGFNSQNNNRDANALEVLDVLNYPNIEFTAMNIIETEGQMNIEGTLLFHGIKIEKSIIATAIYTDNKELELKGSFDLNLLDFDIKLPSFMLKKMNETVKIEYLLKFVNIKKIAEDLLKPQGRLRLER